MMETFIYIPGGKIKWWNKAPWFRKWVPDELIFYSFIWLQTHMVIGFLLAYWTSSWAGRICYFFLLNGPSFSLVFLVIEWTNYFEFVCVSCQALSWIVYLQLKQLNQAIKIYLSIPITSCLVVDCLFEF